MAGQLGASVLQERIYAALRASRNLADEPDDFLHAALQGCEYSAESVRQATRVIYKSVYYSCSKDLHIDRREQRRMVELIRLLGLDEDCVASLDYEVGLSQYKKRFREAVSDAEVTEEEQACLDAMADFFGLRKRDIKKAISDQALAYYSFVLAQATRDHVLSDEEMADLALIIQRYGLTSTQLRTITVPQKKEILRAALTSIKAKARINEGDREYIRSLAHFLNARELLKPCLMDLDLYQRLFGIRQGELPNVDPGSLILEPAEKLHYSAPVLYETRDGDKIKRRTGTLYVGTFKLRFVGRRCHEIRCKDILEVKFKHTRIPKLSIVLSSGTGGGDYRLRRDNNPSALLELREILTFLGRKSRRMVEPAGKSTSYIPQDIRSEVWYRDAGQCVICGARDYLEYDHVIPRSKGGATTVDNLQILCRKCNLAKSDRI